MTRAWTIALHLVLAVGAVLTALPLWWMVAASFMPTGEASSLPPRLWPSVPTLAQYQALFARRLHQARDQLRRLRRVFDVGDHVGGEKYQVMIAESVMLAPGV